ncbi:MAG: RnfH family protein [Pseudomonadota bacterium]|nr:RnfH family protein [Pseudomonadota bacterium]
MRIRVCLAERGYVRECLVELEEGSTVAAAVRASGLVAADWSGAVGVHGRVVDADQLLTADDRVELYLPLLTDPRTRRRQRVTRRAR